jgi:polysaccharide deacetylase family protein (PEP-CTERM system associated)
MSVSLSGQREPTERAQRLDGALTIDLEDWRCALHPKPGIDYRNRPPIDESYLRQATNKMLGQLEERGVRATFFVLGEVASAVPDLVQKIAQKGHEIASHSPVHLPPRSLPREELALMIRRDVSFLEDLAGKRPVGFRAPYFAVRRDEGWLLKILADCGFRYDSSVVPTWTPYWGIPSAPKIPYYPDFLDLAKASPNGPILELPVTVWPSWKPLMGLPIGGGFYMRAWPTEMLIRVLRRNVAAGYPLVLYIHPGNLESEKEKIASPTMRDRISQYAATSRGATSFRRILREFRFGTMSAVFSEELGRMDRETKPTNQKS